MRRTLALAALVTGVVTASTALAAPTEGSSRLFLRADDCSGSGYLSLTAGTDDGGHGCSYYGLPLDEAVYQAEGAVLTPLQYSTRKDDGVPLVLDADRDVTGVVASDSTTPSAGGVGEVVVDVELYATRLVNGRPKQELLGSGSFTATAVPTSPTTSVPFSLDLPSSFDSVEVVALSLTANIRGANVNASGQSLNGTSYVDLPTVVDDGTVEEPAQP